MIGWTERAPQDGIIIAPDERLPWPQTVALGLQHVVAMFGATVLAPRLMGFDPNLAILMSGIGTLLHHMAPRAEVIGCWPENSAVLYESLKAGRIIEAPESATLSESTAGGVEAGSITFDLCREVMHHGVLVTEDEILSAMRWGHAQGWAMEGASGVALAAYFKEAARYAGRKAVVLICGGNPSPAIRDLLG